MGFSGLSLSSELPLGDRLCCAVVGAIPGACNTASCEADNYYTKYVVALESHIICDFTTLKRICHVMSRTGTRGLCPGYRSSVPRCLAQDLVWGLKWQNAFGEHADRVL